MIKAVIFDCFGVLITDGLRAIINTVDKTDPEAAGQLRDILRAVNRGTLTRQESSQLMGDVLGIKPDELLRSIDNSLVKNKDLITFIENLKPDYTLGLLSNVRGRDRLNELFDPRELRLFDTIIASGDIGIIKPEPEIYELTAEQLGVEPEDCVMIDDLESFCVGAEAVGMRSILFKSNEQFKKDFANLIDSESQTD